MTQSSQPSAMADDVIALMRERLADALAIDDLAHAANYSKFHFCRLFAKETGVTPSRFLSALRLQQSRHLLLKTDATVSDICCAVGYNSVGTFTSRFTRSIGISPSVFRGTGGYSPGSIVADHDVAEPGDAGRTRTIRGQLIAPTGMSREQILLAAFPSPIPEGQPSWCAVLNGPGSWQLPVPEEGVWYVSAAAISPGEAGYFTSPLLEEQAHLVGRAGPIAVSGGDPVADVAVRIHAPRQTDPPILFAPPRQIPRMPLTPLSADGPGFPAPGRADRRGRIDPAWRSGPERALRHRPEPAAILAAERSG